jgi:trimeric autotransporter adhesin
MPGGLRSVASSFGLAVSRWRALRIERLTNRSTAALAVMVAIVSVAAAAPQASHGVPLSTILNPDGSLDLKSGFSGSLDPSGYRIVTGTAGAPRFVQTGGGPESDSDGVYWDDHFGFPGTNGRVWAVVADGVGNMYVGGDFTAVASIRANMIAKWDGSSWSTLKGGTDGWVCALAVSGTDLYVGGSFTKAGDTTAKSIAKWDGHSWSSLGSGFNSAVRAIAVSGSDLYAAGDFTTAGGSSALHVARWTGSSWSALGSGVDDYVYALAVMGGDLYAGGDFATAGGVGASRVARWDGTGWHALGSGVGGTYPSVRALAASGGDLYVGGQFTTAGGVSTYNIARWDGSAWASVGGGVYGTVYCLTVSGTEVFAGGQFDGASGAGMNCVGKWNGSYWSALGSGLNYWVYAVAVSGNNVYAGGEFTRAGGVAANGIAKWDRSSWAVPLGKTGTGLNSPAYALAANRGILYAAGNFTEVSGIRANYIAKWDGSSWSPLGQGVNNTVHSLAAIGNEVFAGGVFTMAGGTAANYIAKWNGVSWSPLGSGMNNTVAALATDGTCLYAGGGFTTAGGIAANYVARWDGLSWSPLGSGTNQGVGAIAVRGSSLYVGGGFTEAGGVAASRIARWDGLSWSALAGGVNDSVLALAVSESDLYAGGYFTMAGGVNARYVARWDGVSWTGLGGGMNDDVRGLALCGNGLYVGGDFTMAGSTSANRLAKWDGVSWSAVGRGLDHDVRSLAVQSNALFASGMFQFAGGRPSLSLSVWQPRVNTTTVTLPVSPRAMTIGNDPYGYYKPALDLTPETAVIHPGGVPTTVTLDRTAEILFGGKRVNGAFKLEPEGVQLVGVPASLLVEFSEDDAVLMDCPYTQFRAVRFDHPSCYPTSMEAVSVTPLPGQSAPFPSRIENGRQIYAIVAPVTTVGGVYGAVPPAVLPKANDTFATSSMAWAPFRDGTPGLHEPVHDTADSALKVAVHPDPTRFRINGWFTQEAGYLPYASIGPDNFVRGRYFVHTGGQSNPSALDTIPAVRMRLSNRFAVTSMLEAFNHLNSDPEVTSCAQELRPSAHPAKPSVYMVDFDPADGPFMVENGATEGVMRAFEAYSTDPQDNGFIALKECAVGVYPAALLDACAAPVKVYAPTATDAGNLALGLPESALVIANYLHPVAEGEIVESPDPPAQLPTHQQGPFGVTLDTTAVPVDRIGTIVREFSPGADVTAPDYVRVDEGKLYRVRWHLTSTQQSNQNAQIRMRARTVKFMFTHKLEIGGAWATGPGTVTSNNAIAQQALPGLGTQGLERDAGGTGGWYIQLVNTPLDPAIRPEIDGLPLSQRMPNLAAQPGPQQPGRSFRDLRVGLDIIDTLTQTPNSPLEKGNVTVDRIEVFAFPNTGL